MLQIKEFDNCDELNKFILDNRYNMTDNHSIEIYKCQKHFIREFSYSNERFVIPYEKLIYVLRYEIIR